MTFGAYEPDQPGQQGQQGHPGQPGPDGARQSAVPNLYEAFGLDCDDACQGLGILLAGQDAQLEGQGYGTHSPQRKRTQIAFAVLSDPVKRARYDKELASGRSISWSELEHLGIFGDWTDPILRVEPSQPQSLYSSQTQPESQPQPEIREQTASPYAQPFNPFQRPGYQHRVPATYHQNSPAGPAGQAHIPEKALSAYANGPADRPSSATRIFLSMVDMIFAFAVSGSVMAAMSERNDAMFVVMSLLIGILYLVGTETYFGASPAKKLAGYEVRDRRTGEKLSVVQSAKRQWFKIANFIPGPGNIAAFVFGLWGAASIKPNSYLLAIHDELAGAEVVKKNP